MDWFGVFNDTATTEIYTLSLHDALPISENLRALSEHRRADMLHSSKLRGRELGLAEEGYTYFGHVFDKDRKSTRLNSSHANISYAVFCLKKKPDPSFHHFCRTLRLLPFS